MPASAISINGLADLQRALKSCEREVRLGVKAALRVVAEPVRVEAERLAQSEIRNIGETWSQMRTGVTTTLVYVVPKQRGSSGGPRKRRNLFGLLADRALDPALETKKEEVERGIEKALDDILDRNW